MRWFASAVPALAALGGAARAGEAEAAKRVEQLGGTVTRDGKQPGSPAVKVTLTGPKVKDEKLKLLKGFPQLAALGLSGAGVTDAGLRQLRDRKQLKSLSLSHTLVTGAGLEEVKELKQLGALNLVHTKVTAAGVKEPKAAPPGATSATDGAPVHPDCFGVSNRPRRRVNSPPPVAAPSPSWPVPWGRLRPRSPWPAPAAAATAPA